MDTWLYHREHGGKIFSLSDDDVKRSEEMEELYAQGWQDTPVVKKRGRPRKIDGDVSEPR